MSRTGIIAVTLTGALAGCSLFVPWGSIYSGSGTYERGNGMFQVRLTRLPLDRVSSGCSTLSSLGPDWEWTAVVLVEATDGNLQPLYVDKTSKLQPKYVPLANLELSLVNETRKQLFSTSAPLNTWEWNWNRAVRRGRGEEYQSSPGTWQFRRFDVGPDGAWGTSFTPRFSGIYTLCYRVIDPAPIPPGTTVWLTVETYLGSL